MATELILCRCCTGCQSHCFVEDPVWTPIQDLQQNQQDIKASAINPNGSLSPTTFAVWVRLVHKPYMCSHCDVPDEQILFAKDRLL